ncbi:MAG: rhodanese-like domain-containing protein [Anaerolineae bacterium]
MTKAARLLISVPEVTAVELMAELRNGNGHPTLLLDCREYFERRQGYLPDSLHIPMNYIPYRLAELDGAADIVVYCAHGNRSYGVAGWPIQQGFTARSLKGGIVEWQLRGGEVRRDN